MMRAEKLLEVSTYVLFQITDIFYCILLSDDRRKPPALIVGL